MQGPPKPPKDAMDELKDMDLDLEDLTPEMICDGDADCEDLMGMMSDEDLLLALESESDSGDDSGSGDDDGTGSEGGDSDDDEDLELAQAKEGDSYSDSGESSDCYSFVEGSWVSCESTCVDDSSDS